MDTRTVLFGVFAAAFASHAAAVDIECRFVEQLGPHNADYAVLPDSQIIVRPGSSHRLRIQFMAVPEPDEDIVAFIGWINGTIETTGGINTRTARPPDPLPRGRLRPFVFAIQGEGLPSEDPFTSLDSIDCTIGTEGTIWVCNPDGTVPPMPLPPRRGVDAFVSTYQITTVTGPTDYTITYAGRAVAATEWRYGNCFPPDCGDPNDPDDDIPSGCTFAPFPTDPLPFSTTLHVIVCPAEWNDDRVVNSQDFFDFLADFFAGDADFNGDMVTDSRDYFEYLASFLEAC